MVMRVSPGQPWAPGSANDHNDIAEATEIVLGKSKTRNASQKKQWILPTDWIFCQNGSGNRLAGEVLEAGNYLLAEFDPMALWYAGQAPTAPLGERTHGVLRVACKNGDIERVQISGVCRALVNVTNTNHTHCDAKEGVHVLQSCWVGPHKIVAKDVGTGQMECAVNLYAAGEVLAEAYLMSDLCPTDEGGTGTGSELATASVHSAKLMPYGAPFTPTKVTNPQNHSAPAGSRVMMSRKRLTYETEEWQIFEVELRPFCAMAGVEDRPSCLVGWGLKISAEWCPTNEPTDACVIVAYNDCGTGLPGCDTSLEWDPLYACCEGGGTFGS